MSATTTNENPPARIGRYDVVFPLATRILSSLVVARLGEPGASPVTIMHFDPDLTQGRDLETFLFSVREALGVRHPNVAAIRELRNDDGEIYLVMEHLEGESAAALIHRLDVDGRGLDFELAAHVAAEASNALDAGSELGLLHEHLTPHDIFIGYDGSVKVLDIGIARALDELLGAKTIAERDLPYASPERCKGEPLDRRSDVYSLGAILWELMTGASPFERKTQADTLRAILTDEPKVTSTKILRRLPTELSHVALRALARDPAERYESAKAFGDALRAFVRSVPMGGAEPSTPLATLMQSQFAKRIKNNTRMLRRFDASTRGTLTSDEPPPSSRPDLSQLDRPTVDAFRPVQIIPESVPIEKEPETPRLAAPTVPPPPEPPPPEPPPPEPPPAVDEKLLEADVPEEIVSAPVEPAPHVEPAVELPLEVSLAEADTAFPEPRASGGKPGGVWLVLGLVVVLGLVAIVFMSQSSSAPPVATPPVATAVATAVPARVEPTAAPTASASAALPETATIHIDTTPTKATIVVGDTTMGVSPIDLKLPRGPKPVTVEVRATGYQSATESIVPDADQRFKFSLAVVVPTPAPVPVPAPTSTAPPTPAAASASGSPYFRFQ